jgi:hypothetical protein
MKAEQTLITPYSSYSYSTRDCYKRSLDYARRSQFTNGYDTSTSEAKIQLSGKSRNIILAYTL